MSACRCAEPGWTLVASHDDTGRRGLWMRGDAQEGIELCAGREGDDEYVSLKPGETLTGEMLSRIYACMLSLGDPPGIDDVARVRVGEDEPEEMT